MRQNKNQAGFIPMIILLVIILGILIWLAYHHVSSAHQNTIKQKATQYENTINR